ncbi:MAG: phytoene desaturase family protein [Gaiellales bacterium]
MDLPATVCHVPTHGGRGDTVPPVAYDAIIVGGGHNGLAAAAYLGRAGRRVLVLERLGQTGGAAVSERPFLGVDVRLSRYAYLVSLMPTELIEELGLSLDLRSREVSSYTPTHRDGRDTGLLVARRDAETQLSMRSLTGSDRAWEQWQAFGADLQEIATRLAPTLLETLPSKADARARFRDRPDLWEALAERPLGEWLERALDDDLLRGVAFTDGLIGTFASARDASLAQNRCFLYHVVGDGTGDWKVPVGGMGAVSSALDRAARAAGAEILTGAEVLAVHDGADGAEVTWRDLDGEHAATAPWVLANVAPAVLARLLDEAPPEPAPVGAQLKVNMVLTRLPRLKSGRDPKEAFAGTFHVDEGYAELEAAYREAAAGRLPSRPPSELYCHTLTDPSIMSAELQAKGYQTLTLFGLHAPDRLFADDPAGTTAAYLERTLAGFEAHLDEPLMDVIALDQDGRPCIDAKCPIDLEEHLGLPGGNIFHRDLQWPWAEQDDEVGTWGVGTGHDHVLLCGSGARRGGAVSGIAGRSAAMHVLGRR